MCIRDRRTSIRIVQSYGVGGVTTVGVAPDPMRIASGLVDGIVSSSAFRADMIGIERIIPTMPHIQPQKRREKRTTTGLSSKLGAKSSSCSLLPSLLGLDVGHCWNDPFDPDHVCPEGTARDNSIYKATSDPHGVRGNTDGRYSTYTVTLHDAN